jgi:hypothetical protein
MDYSKSTGILGNSGLCQLDDEDAPLLTPPSNDICQIGYINYDPIELARLEARTFTKEVIGIDQGWDDLMVRCFVFETDSPLPSCVPLAIHHRGDGQSEILWGEVDQFSK